MDLATILGLVLGTITIVVVMLISGSLLMYWDFLSLLVVVGGAICSSMMRWPLSLSIGSIKLGMSAVISSVEPPEQIIDQVIDLANKARKESILSLEKEQVDNPLLAKGIRLAVDGADPEIISQIIDDDIRIMKKRLTDGRGFFEDMGEACPAFGMIGTVIGLVVIMANLSDPTKIGPGLAVALVTTLYGSLISNLLFIPLAKKLKYRMGEQARNAEIIKTGVLGILTGINPKLINERLASHVEGSDENAA